MHSGNVYLHCSYLSISVSQQGNCECARQATDCAETVGRALAHMQSALAVVLAIVLCSITGTCGRTLSPSQSLSNSTTQLTLFQQIAADLAPYAKCGISQAMIDGVYCGIQDPGFRVQIKHNKVYIAGEVKGFQSRNRNVKLALLDMASHYKRLPDVDFVVGTADFSASEVRPVLGMTEGGPVFAQVRIQMLSAMYLHAFSKCIRAQLHRQIMLLLCLLTG